MLCLVWFKLVENSSSEIYFGDSVYARFDQIIVTRFDNSHPIITVLATDIDKDSRFKRY